MGEKGARAYLPFGLIILAFGSLFYGIPAVKAAADSLVFVAVTLAVGFVGIGVSDTSLLNWFVNVIDFQELSKTWKESVESIHGILSDGRSFLDDVRSAENKTKIAKKFIPVVSLRLGAYYLTGFSLLFAINDVLAVGSTNFLDLLGNNRLGFAMFFIVIALAASFLINPVEPESSQQQEGLQGLGKQVLGSYFLENVRERNRASGLVVRALVPFVTIQLLFRARPMRSIAGLYHFENVNEILQEEIEKGRIEQAEPDTMKLLQTVKESGYYEVTDAARPRLLDLQEISKLDMNKFLGAIFSGEKLKGTIISRFRPKTKRGLIAVTALRGCFSRVRAIGMEGNRVIIKEESEPKTIFFLVGFGDQAVMTALELQFSIRGKKLAESELSPCGKR